MSLHDIIGPRPSSLEQSGPTGLRSRSPSFQVQPGGILQGSVH